MTGLRWWRSKCRGRRTPPLGGCGDQQETGFVDTAEVGAQPRRVFLPAASPSASNVRWPARRPPPRDVRVSGGSNSGGASSARYDPDDLVDPLDLKRFQGTVGHT